MRSYVVSVVTTVLVSAVAYGQTPMGTAFTYQGKLADAGGPITATCDFYFSVWDAAVAGTEKAFVPQSGVSVQGGLFTVTIDVDPGVFTGDSRWLGTGVCCPSPCAPDWYTLTPRQEMTPAPHALALPGLWTQQDATSPNLIGGYSGNIMGPGVVGATISGGGEAGLENSVTAAFGAIGGGEDNTATGAHATISGGLENTASGSICTVGGGKNNMASGPHAATVGGGYGNTANTFYATVGGGLDNWATGQRATVAGGRDNIASGLDSTVAGGQGNEATGDRATIAGGSSNEASDEWSTVGGGNGNQAQRYSSTVGGGLDNRAAGLRATVGGGYANEAGAQDSTVGGGYDNGAIGDSSTVSGGNHNRAEGTWSTIGGGVNNSAAGDGSMVIGGIGNRAGGRLSFAAGTDAHVRDAVEAGEDPTTCWPTCGDEGTFLWNDGFGGPFQSGTPNSFLIKTQGGVGINTNFPWAALDVRSDDDSKFGLPLAVTRATSAGDGTLVSFAANGSTVANITVVGGGVSYNPFTGSHYGWTKDHIDHGILVAMTGNNRHYGKRQDGELIHGIEPSNRANHPRCMGAYMSEYDAGPHGGPDDTHLVMAVGNGDMWVVDSGNDFQPGDYLISSDVVGHAMMDDPDKFENGHVVARASEGVDWSTVTETVNGRKHKKISVFFESFVRGNSVALAKVVELQQEQIDALQARLAELEGRIAADSPTSSRAGLGIAVGAPALAFIGLLGLASHRRIRKGGV